MVRWEGWILLVLGVVWCFGLASTSPALAPIPWTDTSAEAADPDLSPKDGSPRWILPFSYPYPRSARAENFIRFGRQPHHFKEAGDYAAALLAYPTKPNKKNNFIRLGRENPRQNNFIRLGRSGTAENWQWKEEPESREDYAQNPSTNSE